MFYHVQLIKGILSPNTYLYQLTKAEKITGLYIRFLLLMAAGAILYLAAAYTGYGMDIISNEISNVSQQELETKKLFLGIGKVVWGIVFSLLIFFVPAIFYWTIMDTEFAKLLVMQLFVLAVLLIEKALTLVLQISFGLERVSSPFSLGVMVQYLTDNRLLIQLAGTITLFQIWVIFFQYMNLKAFSPRSPKWILLIVIIVNLVGWIMTSTIYYLEFEKLI
ncbi:hypothetical protein BK139_06720 [Paenibacillus sp. FSL R5-0490]|uniref:hypothetical protein n=1 Tax=Paenibacillus sp. FSL R5-0490 TaxID=1920424 RepID=UPI00096BF1AB|nr:hypothetical protein [Paenibacillus sp. FSL R5-0490]OMF61528.1 hypothetical protein BK139_06720 [Paenibacillus sp. FSL R5-0490]